MEFIDLAAQQRRIRADLGARIAAVLDHGHYIMGPEVAELEARLCALAGARHTISCASGTDSLLMVLMAWGIGPGDAVFMPPFTFFATAEVVAMLGATPVFVDILPDTFTMNPAALAKAVQAVRTRDARIHPLPVQARAQELRPRAVIPVDLFGQAPAYADIFAVAREHALLVLEDAAQSFGGSQGGRMHGALGCHAASASFFPAKPLGCYGDGGAILTDDDALADVLRSIRVHGKGGDKYDNVRIGLNGRLDTLQAAVLLAKLEIFEDEIRTRQTVAAWYTQALAGVPGLTPPHIAPGNVSAWAQYCLLVAGGKRDAVAAYLRAQGIPTNIYYPKPLHMLQAFASMGYQPADMPVSLASSRAILALPFHPYLQQTDVAAISARIAEAVGA